LILFSTIPTFPIFSILGKCLGVGVFS
jgi:hypothetical protein